MTRSRSLDFITLADFIVRSAYQMGKTPLLPILALSLGAVDTLLGFIVSVSTLTGMVLKPLVGTFSDRWGRRNWLLVGTAFFALMPFTYRFVHTPEQLFVVRIIHGLATAIYGPVTLAYVAEQSEENVAERLGWFSMARTAGYIVGPAVAGWLLLTLPPVSVFTIIGILSSLAFLPILLLPDSKSSSTRNRPPLVRQVRDGLSVGSRTPSVWLAGGLESTMYIALYAVKAFLPIYALSIGTSVALVGSFFAIQEATHMLLKPFCGRLGDRLGYTPTVSLGMLVLGTALPLVANAESSFILLVPSVLMGVAQALISPSTMALVSTQADENNTGAAMGLVGTLRNAGKVAGPILAGALIHWLDFSTTLDAIGVVVLLSAVVIWHRAPLFDNVEEVLL